MQQLSQQSHWYKYIHRHRQTERERKKAIHRDAEWKSGAEECEKSRKQAAGYFPTESGVD